MRARSPPGARMNARRSYVREGAKRTPSEPLAGLAGLAAAARRARCPSTSCLGVQEPTPPRFQDDLHPLSWFKVPVRPPRSAMAQAGVSMSIHG